MSDVAPWNGGRSVLRAAVGASVIGAVVVGVGFVADLKRTLISLLVAFIWLASLLTGALFLLMTTHAARSQWTILSRRLVEHVVAVLPVLFILFVPIGVLSGQLISPPAHLTGWLSPPFFLLRGLLWIGSWVFLAERLRTWSLRQDVNRSPSRAERSYALSAGGLLLAAFTFTFACFDWIMALTPGWKSSIFGIYVFSGGFVSAFALLIVLMERSRFVGLTEEHFVAAGRWLLAFTIFWVYATFAQFLIIWIADIPAETTWWAQRMRGWSTVSIALVGAQFVVPFFFLLSKDLKRRPRALAALSLWILAAHVIDSFWLVVPAFEPTPRIYWADPFCFFLMIGASVAFGLWRAQGHSLVPVGDARLSASVAYEAS